MSDRPETTNTPGDAPPRERVEDALRALLDAILPSPAEPRTARSRTRRPKRDGTARPNR